MDSINAQFIDVRWFVDRSCQMIRFDDATVKNPEFGLAVVDVRSVW